MNTSIIIPEFNFWSVLLLICAGQALFLSIVLMIHKKGNKIANKILAVLFFFFAYYFVFIAFYWSRYLLEFPHLMGTLRILSFAWGPLFFLYISYLLDKRNDFEYKKLLHFIPAAISTLLGFKTFLLTGDEKLKIFERVFTVEQAEFPIINLLPNFLFILHLSIYVYLSIRKISSRSQSFSDNKVTLDYINYKWLVKLSIGFVLFFASWFVYEIFMSFGVKYYVEVDYLITFFGVVIVYMISTNAFRHPEIISGISEVKNGVKYERSNFTEGEASAYIDQLNKLMNEEKLYLNPELNIRILADKINITPHKFSQLINEFMKVNFADFINSYRVEEAKTRLINPDYSNYTILSIAFDVGFNNKVSFNNAFKKITGITPSEYKFSQSPHYTN